MIACITTFTSTTAWVRPIRFWTPPRHWCRPAFATGSGTNNRCCRSWWRLPPACRSCPSRPCSNWKPVREPRANYWSFCPAISPRAASRPTSAKATGRWHASNWRVWPGMRWRATPQCASRRTEFGRPATIELMTPNQPGQMPKMPIPGVKNLIAVGSGKGGVGKTTVAVNLAVGLASLGYKAGPMGADGYGSTLALMLGVNETPMALGDRIQPLQQYGVKLMSMGFLSPGDKPLVWRGPMLHSVIQQFVRGVDWGELDYRVQH